MRKLVYLLLMIALVGCGKAVEKHAFIARGATVLVLGDSLSYGTGAKVGEDYPTLLAKSTGWQMLNEGIPGHTSAQGLERLDALLSEHHPQLLIVELGGNDFLHQVPAAQTIANLTAILTQAKAQSVPTILVGIPEFSAFRAAVGNLQDHPLYEKLAKETKTPLITDVFSKVLSDGDLKADQIHPNAQGYALVASKMRDELKYLGFVSD